MDFVEPLVRKMVGDIPPIKKSDPSNLPAATKEMVGLKHYRPVVCLYHADCFDGTGAAWALTKRFPNATCIPVNYNEDPPLNQIPVGAHVYVVDFCYNIDRLLMLAAVADRLHIYDHHAGQESTMGLFNDYMQDLGWADTHKAVFNNHMSGAKLTWTILHPSLDVPLIIEHISDRDLWLFDLDETKAVMAGLGTYPLDLVVWDRLFRWTPHYDASDFGSPHQAAVDALETDGHVILRAQQVEIDRIIQNTRRKMRLESVEREVTLINVPRHLASEALSQIAADEELAVGYFDSEGHREFSLRSRKGGPDVKAIAQLYPGGGGHLHAAGFRLPRTHPLAQY